MVVDQKDLIDEVPVEVSLPWLFDLVHSLALMRDFSIFLVSENRYMAVWMVADQEKLVVVSHINMAESSIV